MALQHDTLPRHLFAEKLEPRMMLAGDDVGVAPALPTVDDASAGPVAAAIGTPVADAASLNAVGSGLQTANAADTGLPSVSAAQPVGSDNLLANGPQMITAASLPISGSQPIGGGLAIDAGLAFALQDPTAAASAGLNPSLVLSSLTAQTTQLSAPAATSGVGQMTITTGANTPGISGSASPTAGTYRGRATGNVDAPFDEEDDLMFWAVNLGVPMLIA